MVYGLPSINLPKEVCAKCCESKQPRKSFEYQIPAKSNEKLAVVCSDVCGAFEVTSLGGNVYFVSFIDEYTKKMWLYLIKKKSEVFTVFQKFKLISENKVAM